MVAQAAPAGRRAAPFARPAAHAPGGQRAFTPPARARCGHRRHRQPACYTCTHCPPAHPTRPPAMRCPPPTCLLVLAHFAMYAARPPLVTTFLRAPLVCPLAHRPARRLRPSAWRVSSSRPPIYFPRLPTAAFVANLLSGLRTAPSGPPDGPHGEAQAELSPTASPAHLGRTPLRIVHHEGHRLDGWQRLRAIVVRARGQHSPRNAERWEVPNPNFGNVHRAVSCWCVSDGP